MNVGVRMGWSYLSRRFMPRAFFSVLLYSFILVGQTHAQEVIVARETKPEAPKQAPPPPAETPSESPTPAKPKSRGKRSTSAEPTLEQMRMAGALAAERQKAQARKATPVLNKGVVAVQNSPRA